jgi:hypothetical protein
MKFLKKTTIALIDRIQRTSLLSSMLFLIHIVDGKLFIRLRCLSLCLMRNFHGGILAQHALESFKTSGIG